MPEEETGPDDGGKPRPRPGDYDNDQAVRNATVRRDTPSQPRIGERAIRHSVT